MPKLANSFRSSSISGEPHTRDVVRTFVLPPAMTACVPLSFTARLVGWVPPYSRLRFRNPSGPSGRPVLPANVKLGALPPMPLHERPMGPHVAGSPSFASKYRPVRNSMLPPERAFLSSKFMTPAMASEPYCAAAPSRSTSTCRRAMDGMADRSGPCAPSAMPLPSQAMTAARWRRLPLTRISVWSGAMLRRLAGRTMVAASLMGWVLTLNDGTTVRNWLVRSTSPWLVKSSARMTSTGTGEAVTDRGSARVPTTATVSWSSTPISTSRVTGRPGWTMTPARTAVVNPGRTNVTSYDPGGSASNTNRPVPSVKTVATSPLAWSRASTVTPGRTPPVVSVTAPLMEASWPCASAGARATARIATRASNRMGCILFVMMTRPPQRGLRWRQA